MINISIIINHIKGVLMHFKKIFAILLTLLFVSCSSITDMGGTINDNKREGLDNAADQQKINEVFDNISMENYSQTVSNLSAIYAKRITIIGQKAHSPHSMTNKVFSVWPKQERIKFGQFKKEKLALLHKFQSKANKLKAKGKSSTNALDIMVNSTEADSGFSNLVKRYFKDAQKIVNKHDKKPSFYSSRLRALAKKYQNKYDLTNEDYLIIAGISQSVSTNLNIMSKSDIRFTSKLRAKCKSQNSLNYQINKLKFNSVEGDSPCPYTDSNGNFDPDWSGVAFTGLMSGGTAMLSFTVNMGWAAFTSQAALDPEVLAGEYVASGVGGVVSGSVTALAEQRSAYANCN